MKKILLSFLVIAVFAVFTFINIKTAEAIKQKKEAWELGYGEYFTETCTGGTCNWAKCNLGTGDCTFDMQHECCRY